MTHSIRNAALLQNNLEACIRNAGPAGIPLLEALQRVSGRVKPLGSDYTLGGNLRKAGLIQTIRNLPNGKMTAYHKEFVAALPKDAAPVPDGKPDTKPAKRVIRRRKSRPAAGILITIQYGKHESITLSMAEAHALYGELAAIFGRQ